MQRWLVGKPDWLLECVSQPLHDTHEHLQTESQRLAQSANPLLLLRHYLPTDLAGAGASARVADKLDPSNLDARESQWREDFSLIEPWWEQVSCSGYGRALLRSLDCVFGLKELSADSLEKVREWLMAHQKPGICETLADRAAILTTQTNSFDSGQYGRLPIRRTTEPDRFLRDLFVDVFFLPGLWPAAENEKGLEIRDSRSWVELVRRYFEEDAAGCVAVKCALAYSCDLALPGSSEAEADRVIQSAAKEREVEPMDVGVLRPFWGWGLREILRLAADAKLPVKFHTGHYAGPGSEPLVWISQNLINLEPLIREFPQTKFILLHHAYPYGEAAVTLAKSFPNAFIDQSWLWGMNPAAGVRYLKEFLTGAPRNKIFLFGGDCHRLENSIGHADLARHGLGVALWELFDQGWINSNEALSLARACCFENQEAVFPKLAQLHNPENRRLNHHEGHEGHEDE